MAKRHFFGVLVDLLDGEHIVVRLVAPTRFGLLGRPYWEDVVVNENILTQPGVTRLERTFRHRRHAQKWAAARQPK